MHISKKGKLLSREEFPGDVVRLNSKVKLKEAGNNKTMEPVLVMPEEADIKQKKISVMTPAGIALIGFREGQEVMWEALREEKNSPSWKWTISKKYHKTLNGHRPFPTAAVPLYHHETSHPGI